MVKKKKRAELEAELQSTSENHEPQNELDLSNNKKKKKKKKKRDYQNDDASNELPTVSIAVPGSIIDNAQSLELATRLASQIARAATIFRIDEVVVFDNKSNLEKDPAVNNSDENESGAAFLFRILQYLETPQYLRKALFPMHSSLRFVGMLPPLDAPHHLRKHEWAPFREGVTLKERVPNSGGTLVDVGLNKNVLIDQVLKPGVRVTVAMGTNRNLDSDFPRNVVPASKPKEETGMYWGYKVRYASDISSVFKDCSYKGGYDHLIGTSEHGDTVNSSELTLPNFRNLMGACFGIGGAVRLWTVMTLLGETGQPLLEATFPLESSSVTGEGIWHLLIAFGGLAGLEESIEEDDNLKQKNAREVFDSYFNTCPHQGSRTIRTEVPFLLIFIGLFTLLNIYLPYVIAYLAIGSNFDLPSVLPRTNQSSIAES
ncbi:hypothetical protein Patl1_25420 [Pistacia atlantica]|uniref:Uncharacterized protein n=1 Tax=Pistacia atlantica TaxID=434234 RepID=A0ACC1B4Q8_9ROSI|nr:hypothetical protein Patl1_25420 [Pistacia atlantica]